MKKHVQDIVLAFYNSFKLLNDHKLTLRTIQPSTVLYDDKLKAIIFTDLRHYCKHNEDVVKQTETSFPYSCSFEPMLLTKGSSEPGRDRWSVAVILLEILVGSELILSQGSYEELKNLL